MGVFDLLAKAFPQLEVSLQSTAVQCGKVVILNGKRGGDVTDALSASAICWPRPSHKLQTCGVAAADVLCYTGNNICRERVLSVSFGHTCSAAT